MSKVSALGAGINWGLATTEGDRLTKRDAEKESAKHSAGGRRLEDARARMYEALIFEAAESAFAERGFAGTTMQQIATEAGVSLKTVYGTYPGKRELFDLIMHQRGEALHHHMREAVASTTGVLAQLRSMTSAFVEYLFEHREWLEIHLRSRIAWSMRPSGDDAGDLWRKGLEDLEALIEAGMAAGVFEPGDSSELAVLLTTVMKVEVTTAADRGEREAEPVSDRAFLYLTRLLGAAPSEGGVGDEI